MNRILSNDYCVSRELENGYERIEGKGYGISGEAHASEDAEFQNDNSRASKEIRRRSGGPPGGNEGVSSED